MEDLENLIIIIIIIILGCVPPEINLSRLYVSDLLCLRIIRLYDELLIRARHCAKLGVQQTLKIEKIPEL